MTLLAIDIGTTHCKAGLFSAEGVALQLAVGPTPALRDRSGATVIPPDALWSTVSELIDTVTAAAGRPSLAAVGVASMAETGLLLGRQDGRPRTPLLPWHNESAAPQAARIAAAAPAAERLATFGIYPSYKCSLAKLLHIRDQSPQLLEGSVWLCSAGYIVQRLCGALATDQSLAGRTHAFDLRTRAWHAAWLATFGLRADLFPTVLPGGALVARTTDVGLARIGIAPGTPVAICGHDHICAAFGAGAVAPGEAFDSLGTAEVLLGGLAGLPSPDEMLDSGLTFGLLPAGLGWYWLGGLSAAGGSLDWLRRILGDPPLSYADLQTLQEGLDLTPGDLLYLPYLAGSGAPTPRPEARGAFIGLAAAHSRVDLLRAVLAGTAYQLEAIRHAAVGLVGRPIERIAVGGGGARNRTWLQIKADVYGAPIVALVDDETTLLGAALLAGLGAGQYQSTAEAVALAARRPALEFHPDPTRHELHAARFAQVFEPWRLRLTRP